MGLKPIFISWVTVKIKKENGCEKSVHAECPVRHRVLCVFLEWCAQSPGPWTAPLPWTHSHCALVPMSVAVQVPSEWQTPEHDSASVERRSLPSRGKPAQQVRQHHDHRHPGTCSLAVPLCEACGFALIDPGCNASTQTTRKAEGRRGGRRAHGWPWRTLAGCWTWRLYLPLSNHVPDTWLAQWQEQPRSVVPLLSKKARCTLGESYVAAVLSSRDFVVEGGIKGPVYFHTNILWSLCSFFIVLTAVNFWKTPCIFDKKN